MICTGNTAAVTPTLFWRFLLAFCLAELHLISVFRRVFHTATSVLCSEAGLAQTDLLCKREDFYTSAWAQRLPADTRTGVITHADRCDLCLGFLNGVARLQ